MDEYLNFAQEELTKLLKNKENIDAIKNFLEGEKPIWAENFKK